MIYSYNRILWSQKKRMKLEMYLLAGGDLQAVVSEKKVQN